MILSNINIIVVSTLADCCHIKLQLFTTVTINSNHNYCGVAVHSLNTVYKAYAHAVRQEYIHVPHDQYCEKRAKVL